jgi:uncharacterized membrane protein YsdA (DUF1294 family)
MLKFCFNHLKDEFCMTVAFCFILLGLAALIPPLRYNRFYLLNAALVIGSAYIAENHYFRIQNIFSYKTLLLFVVFHLACINITTVIAYGVDKRAAIRKAWRVPEKDLHTLEFLGGWIGAGIAQKLFHHKTVKKSFQNMYKLMIVMELVAIVILLKFLGLI